jgi:hypothetical protein
MTRIVNRWQNEELDALETSLGYTSVISTEFKQKVLSYIQWVGSNGINYQEEVIESIEELRTDMERVSIFSDKFINDVCLKLKFGLSREIDKKDNRELQEWWNDIQPYKQQELVHKYFPDNTFGAFALSISDIKYIRDNELKQ